VPVDEGPGQDQVELLADVFADLDQRGAAFGGMELAKTALMQTALTQPHTGAVLLQQLEPRAVPIAKGIGRAIAGWSPEGLLKVHQSPSIPKRMLIGRPPAKPGPAFASDHPPQQSGQPACIDVRRQRQPPATGMPAAATPLPPATGMPAAATPLPLPRAPG